MSVSTLTWEHPPFKDDPTVPTREQIGAALAERPGQYAIVARHDRAARAQAHVERIRSGREYGEGFQALPRRVGNEHRVYAAKR
jgi:hypothetical protein